MKAPVGIDLDCVSEWRCRSFVADVCVERQQRHQIVNLAVIIYYQRIPPFFLGIEPSLRGWNMPINTQFYNGQLQYILLEIDTLEVIGIKLILCVTYFFVVFLIGRGHC